MGKVISLIGFLDWQAKQQISREAYNRENAKSLRVGMLIKVKLESNNITLLYLNSPSA